MDDYETLNNRSEQYFNFLKINFSLQIQYFHKHPNLLD